MKPRNKRQSEVLNLSKVVLDVQNEIKSWAFSECNDHIGIATKKHFWCIDCGSESSTKHIKDDAVECQVCKTKLKIVKSLKRTFEQTYYVAFAEVLGEYQVIRLFEIQSIHKKYCKVDFRIQENIMQFIPSDFSKLIYVARSSNSFGANPKYGSLEIRKPSYYKEQFYNPYPFRFFPKSMFKDEYKKIGIDYNLQGLTFITAVKVLENSSNAETLLKAKQYSLFSFCNHNRNEVFYHWGSIKLAIRNNYLVKDADIWLDYLDLLKFFKKDIRCPKYIFPENLQKEHDKLLVKKKKIEKLLEVEKRKAQLIKDEKNYSLKIENFKGLEFSKGKLKIKLLETVQEFIEESELHRHCVYSNKYYEKKDSLCFSAQYDGQRVETVEISLIDYSIIQSRGFENKASEHNKTIIKLLKENLYKVAERVEKLQETA